MRNLHVVKPYQSKLSHDTGISPTLPVVTMQRNLAVQYCEKMYQMKAVHVDAYT